MNGPIKHHYVPQFVLRRFCNSQNKLHAFNKTSNRIRQISPKQVCYEKELYTLIHRDDKSYEIENFYSQLESKYAELLGMFDKSNDIEKTLVELKDSDDISKSIAAFITLSFWRLPQKEGFAKEARKELRKIFDDAMKEKTNLIDFERAFIRELERKKKSVSTKIVQFCILPALLGHVDSKAMHECWFYQTNFDLIISDNPVICTLKENYTLGDDIYLPVGSRMCITNKPNKIKDFQKEIFDNAKNIVLGRSADCFQDFIRATE
jgi:hypothetical protein